MVYGHRCHGIENRDMCICMYVYRSSYLMPVFGNVAAMAIRIDFYQRRWSSSSNSKWTNGQPSHSPSNTLEIWTFLISNILWLTVWFISWSLVTNLFPPYKHSIRVLHIRTNTLGIYYVRWTNICVCVRFSFYFFSSNLFFFSTFFYTIIHKTCTRFLSLFENRTE